MVIFFNVYRSDVYLELVYLLLETSQAKWNLNSLGVTLIKQNIIILFLWQYVLSVLVNKENVSENV